MIGHHPLTKIPDGSVQGFRNRSLTLGDFC
jgi:hypothetical protein